MNTASLLRWKRQLAGLCTAGVVFQGAQCTLADQDLLGGLFQTIASFLVTDWVNDLFGVTSGFGSFF